MRDTNEANRQKRKGKSLEARKKRCGKRLEEGGVREESD